MKLRSRTAGVAALAGFCLATTTSAQSASNSMAAFDGRTGLWNSCVALFAGATPPTCAIAVLSFLCLAFLAQLSVHSMQRMAMG